MDLLRIKYEELCGIETVIRMELTQAREQFMKPREVVLLWLQEMERVQNKVAYIENMIKESSTQFNKKNDSHLKLSALVSEVIKLLDELHRNSQFPNGLVESDRSQLWPTPTMVGISVLNIMDKIWLNLMDRKIGIIGIYGLGGVGKTTIMMNIMSLLATTDIFDKVIWVTVSKDLNVAKMQNDIASQLEMDLRMYDDEDIMPKSARLLERLKKMKKYLVIFDDLWGIVPLEQIGIPQPSKENGCKIVLISRFFEICYSMGSNKIIQVGILSPEEAWELFVSKAGYIVHNPLIQPFARRVARACCRVPIVIISVGLSMKNEASVKAWKKALVDLRGPVAESHDIVMDLLKFSYTRLSNKAQMCFLYCAFFPEDYLFTPEELIRYWMAEGFTQGDGDILSEIDEGFKILNALQDTNMLEKLTKSGDDCFRMHDLFRDLAIRISKDETGFFIKAGLGLYKLPVHEEWEEASKISFMKNQIRKLDVVATNCPNVSTMLFRDNPISHILSPFFSQMHTLTFLDISYTLITELPLSLSELAHLRVLFLHYCTQLEKMPSLEKLKRLQVLSLCGTSITELPLGMEELVSLRSLDLSETTKLESVQVGVISSLSNLEELRLQGCGLCKMDTPMVANYHMEMRSLKRLAILTLSAVGYGDHLDTIMCLQEHNLKIFSINMYGSTEDYIEEVETN